VLIIPLRAVPSQIVSVTVADQVCRINVYQKSTGLFFDLYVDDTATILGVLCENLNRLVRMTYLGFIGDFTFLDNEGTSDPVYTGLGARYSLAYLEPSELS
jgi:hypothetical protein